MPFVTVIVRTNQKSPHFDQDFWDMPYGTCLSCDSRQLSENCVHLCKKLGNIYLPPCECCLSWGDVCMGEQWVFSTDLHATLSNHWVECYAKDETLQLVIKNWVEARNNASMQYSVPCLEVFIILDMAPIFLLLLTAM